MQYIINIRKYSYHHVSSIFLRTSHCHSYGYICKHMWSFSSTQLGFSCYFPSHTSKACMCTKKALRVGTEQILLEMGLTSLRRAVHAPRMTVWAPSPICFPSTHTHTQVCTHITHTQVCTHITHMRAHTRKF